MFKSTVLCVSAGTDSGFDGHSVVCTTGGIFTFGSGAGGRLGHGGDGNGGVPRMLQGLGSIEVVMVSAGACHTLVCNDCA